MTDPSEPLSAKRPPAAASLDEARARRVRLVPWLAVGGAVVVVAVAMLLAMRLSHHAAPDRVPGAAPPPPPLHHGSH